MVKEFTPEELEDKRSKFEADFHQNDPQRDDMSADQQAALILRHVPPGTRVYVIQHGRRRRILIFQEGA